jgi:hypothetical protein
LMKIIAHLMTAKLRRFESNFETSSIDSAIMLIKIHQIDSFRCQANLYQEY